MSKELKQQADELLRNSKFFKKKDTRPTVNGRKRRISRKKQKNT